MSRTLLLTVLCVLVGAAATRGDAPIMKLNEVRAGMKGVLKTVLKGVKVEEIPVEVVDVMRKIRPGRDVIIIRLLGERIKRLGLARGMSGSPVYVDGKLLGALAYAWQFVRDPIAGITPAEDMMRVWRKDVDEEKELEVVHTWRAGRTLPVERFIEELLAPKPVFPFIGPANMVTLETPVAVKGFSDASLATLSDRLRAFDVSVVQGAAGGLAKDPPGDVKLEPGSVMCVQVLRGDYEAAALGTVTEVAGNRVYGFGHPLFNNGRVEFPLATGTIHMVVPTQDMSFKLGSALKAVGTVRVDHSAGVGGELGRLPEMLKVSLDVKRGDLLGDARFNFEVAKDPRMMLSFLNAAVGGALSVSGRPGRKVKMIVKATINVEGYPPVEIEEIHGGPQAPGAAVSAFVLPLGQIMHNPYARVNIKSVHISSEVIPGDPRAVIRYARTEKTDYRPGEEIDVAVTIQPYRRKSIIRHYKMKLPGDVPQGRLTLIVCDSTTDARMESREMPHRFRPEGIAQVLDFFRQRRPNTDLVFRLSFRSSGVALSGREFQDLPDSVVSVLGKQSPTEVSRFAQMLVKREPTEFVIIGRHQLQIHVVKD